MSPFTRPFIISPISTHTHTLILLHDRSGNGQDFAFDILSATSTSGLLLQTLFPGTKFIFPTATTQCCTILRGLRMTQWFDNYSLVDPSEREALQLKGLREASHFIHGIVDGEVEGGVPLERIFLGGFSQGSAMALYALLAYRCEGRSGNLGGFVGLSGWLPLRKSLEGLVEFYADGDRDEKMRDFNVDVQVSNLVRNQIGLPPTNSSPPQYSQMPIFLGHGQADDEVSAELARQAARTLTGLEMDVTLKRYEGLSHTWRNGNEVDDIAEFLSACGVK